MTARQPTGSQTAGPFFTVGMREVPVAGLRAGAPGVIRVEGTVLDGAGDPVPDAFLETWQADETGRYPSIGGAFNGFGRCATDAEGHFHFLARKPGRVPHPSGVPQAPHLAVAVFGRALLKQLFTRVYFPDEQAANATDPILSSVSAGRRATLIGRYDSGALTLDIRLQGRHETVFFQFQNAR